MKNIFFLFFVIILQTVFTEELSIGFSDSRVNQNTRVLYDIVGIMVDFEVDDDPETSGNGKFLNDIDVNYIHYSEKSRCNEQTEFLLDKPPHNNIYFELQLEALSNYYYSISNENYDFDYQVLPNVYHLNNPMRFYSDTQNQDDQLGLLFSDALELAKDDIEDLGLNYENTLFVVFHAGLGQEASENFDPTIYDIPSAYIDSEMLDFIPENHWVKENLMSSDIFYGGLVMPETLNWIYYDVIEYIFPPDFVLYDDLENLYCNYQLSMTGLFAHLIGYHFGFYPMYNIETGVTGIGEFGLMDVGFYNWNGIIPSRPNPWTRVNSDINTETIDLTADLSDVYLYQIVQEVTQNVDKIYKIRISDDEYFLLEKRSNLLNQSGSIECIIDEYRNYSSHCILSDDINNSDDYIESNDEYKNIFDVITSIDYSSNFEYNSQYNVITKVSNYDYGLPGSGILIWHINESNFNENDITSIGINGDSENRAVSLEEADGIKNIGNPNFLIFSDNSKGWRYDFWSRWIEGSANEHQMYLDINYGENNWPLNYELIFSDISVPNALTDSNINSSLSIKINNQNNIEIKKSNDYVSESIIIDENIKVIGTDGDNCFYYIKNNSLYTYCDNGQNTFITDQNIDEMTHIIDNVAEVLSDYLNNNANDLIPKGYYSNNTILEEVEEAISLGDIDSDGYDEKIVINNNTLEVYNYSNNGDILNTGFPIYGDFSGYPLISDLLNNDGSPEIIVKNGDHISFISNVGEIIFNIPLFNQESELYIISNWGNDYINALANGDMLYIFECNQESSCSNNNNFWLEPFSTYDFSSVVTGIHNFSNNQESEIGIDMSKAFNYPNPIENEFTKFRFYVHTSSSVDITIFDAAGYIVDELHSENLTSDNYNEINWTFNNLDPGLYFAEIKSDKNETKLIKVVIL